MMRKSSAGDRVFNFVNVSVLSFLSLSILFPFWNLFCMSISTMNTTYIDRFILWPIEPSLRSYAITFQNQTVYTAYWVTIFRVLVGTSLSLVVTSAAAYAWSKKFLRFRAFINWFMIVPMFFGGGLIPSFLLMRWIGLYNTIWVYIMPGIYSTMNAVFIRNYISTLPESIEESAYIDGANDIVIFMRLILPLCKPILATVALWVMVSHWNSWFDSMIYTTKSELQTIGYYLQKIIITNRPLTGFGSELANLQMSQNRIVTPQAIQSAVLLINIVPILFSYPFLQRYFVRGLIVGAIKG